MTAHARLARLDARVSYARLAVVAAFALTGWLVIGAGATPWLFAMPVVAFGAFAVWHDRVLRALDCAARAVTFYDHGIARLEDKWHGIGEPGERFLTHDHLYAHDLDIFGNASLFQLLSRARTHLGEELLARWLSAPANVATVRQRQESIAELREALDFREALATAGGASRDIDTVALSAWASAPAAPESLWLRAAAVVLAAGIIAGVVVWARGGPEFPLLVVIILKMVLTRPSRKRVARVVRGVERPLGQLDILADTLSLVERSTLHSPRLVEIRAEIMSHGVVPSEAIRRLKRLADMLDWRRNAFFAPIAAVVSWALHLSSAIETWRREFGPKVITWLAAVAEYEALSSLAAYAYEHADDPFPIFAEDGGPARFEGASLGHPLVPAARMVRNDVFLTPQTRLLIVSGSNMSGKSTLLRTIGVNVVLAMAGAPVRAAALTLTPLAVGATLHVHDSLQAGRSRFFAEISRIRGIADLAGPLPTPASTGLLFLLDELFQGTNSHDRKIGAEALLLSLIDRGAIGLTTTHDLALTAIAEQSGGRAANVHFEDELKDGELIFDYRMKPGPVTHSNALALMKAVGLPVTTIGRLEDS
ncbi:MAG: DNA mismatch repair protein MutS [Vicinamibacterales bacterium]